MTLYEECIEALGTDIRVYSGEPYQKISEAFQNQVEFTVHGRIDWNRYPHAVSFDSFDALYEIAETEDFLEDEFLVLWDKASVPIIGTNCKNILRNIDDVTAVAFDTWLFNPAKKIAIEFHHEGDIRMVSLT